MTRAMLLKNNFALSILEGTPCPKCRHELLFHATEDERCHVERGNHNTGTLCESNCDGKLLEDVMSVIEAIRQEGRAFPWTPPGTGFETASNH